MAVNFSRKFQDPNIHYRIITDRYVTTRINIIIALLRRGRSNKRETLADANANQLKIYLLQKRPLKLRVLLLLLLFEGANLCVCILYSCIYKYQWRL